MGLDRDTDNNRRRVRRPSELRARDNRALARGARLPRRHCLAAGLARDGGFCEARPPVALRHARGGKLGLDAEPLHGVEKEAPLRRLHAGRRGGEAPRPRDDSLLQQDTRAVGRHSADNRRRRGEFAPIRALRLLERLRAPLDTRGQPRRPARLWNGGNWRRSK